MRKDRVASIVTFGIVILISIVLWNMDDETNTIQEEKKEEVVIVQTKKEPAVEMNSNLFQLDTIKDQMLISLQGNSYDYRHDEFTGKPKDEASGGKVILWKDLLRDYRMTVDMKFLSCNLLGFPGAGWFGFAVRAQDLKNYELIWFMPEGGGESSTVAYLPVAHGVCPWWTEAYTNQIKGDVELPRNDWFTAKIQVRGDECEVWVNNQFVFKKKLTYYLTKGRAGLFVGTATNVQFRNIKIENI